MNTVRRYFTVLLCIISLILLFPFNMVLAEGEDLIYGPFYEVPITEQTDISVEELPPVEEAMPIEEIPLESNSNIFIPNKNLNLTIKQRVIDLNLLDQNRINTQTFNYWMRPADSVSPELVGNPVYQNLTTQVNNAGGLNIIFEPGRIKDINQFNLFDVVYIETSALSIGEETYTYLLSEVMPSGIPVITSPDPSVYRITVKRNVEGELELNVQKEGLTMAMESITFTNIPLTEADLSAGLVLSSLIGNRSEPNAPTFTLTVSQILPDNQTVPIITATGIGDYATNQVEFDQEIRISTPGSYLIDVQQQIPFSEVFYGYEKVYPEDYLIGNVLYDPHSLTALLEVIEGKNALLTLSGNNLYVNDRGLVVESQVVDLGEYFGYFRYSLGLDLNPMEQVPELYQQNYEDPLYLNRIYLESFEGNLEGQFDLINGSTTLYGLSPHLNYTITPVSIPEGLRLITPEEGILQGDTNIYSNFTKTFLYEDISNIDPNVTHLTLYGTRSQNIVADPNVPETQPSIFVITPYPENPISDPIIESRIANIYGETDNIPLIDADYVEEGTYNYIVRESDTAEVIPGTTYDDTVYKVTVQIYRNQYGELAASSQAIRDGTDEDNSSDIVFTNLYNPDIVSYSINADLLSRNTPSDEGTVVLGLEAANEAALKILPNKVYASNISNTVNFSNLYFEDEGTYLFNLTNERLSHINPTYLLEVNVFRNEYGVLSRTVRIMNDRQREVVSVVFNKDEEADELFKVYPVSLTGEVLTIDGVSEFIDNTDFSFILRPESGNDSTDPIPVSGKLITSENGEITIFNDEIYTSPGIYIYSLTQNPNEEVKVDESVYTIYVLVRENKSPVITVRKGSEPAYRPNSKQSISFINSRQPLAENQNPEVLTVMPNVNPLAMIIKGNTYLNNEPPQNGQFSYQISVISPTDAPKPDFSETVNIGDQFKFDPITFNKAGTYIYEITQKPGQEETVNYDSHKYQMTVTIEGDLETSSATWKITDLENSAEHELAFNNYDKGDFEIHARVEGKHNIQSGTCSFRLIPREGNINDPVIISTLSNDKAGNIDIFNGIDFEDGFYQYELSQIIPENMEDLYDSSVYLISINITGEEKELRIDNLSTGESDVEPVFINQTPESLGLSNDLAKITLEKVQYINSKMVPETAFISIDDTLSYKLILTNNSDDILTGAQIIDQIPEGLIVDSEQLEDGVTVENQTLKYQISDMAAHSQLEINYKTTVNPAVKRTVFNSQATLRIDSSFIRSNSVSATVDQSSIAPVIIKQTQSSNLNTDSDGILHLEDGDQITYSISVINNSDAPYYSLVVNDALSGDLNIEDCGDGTVMDNQLNQVVSWNIDTLEPGEVKDLNLRVTAKDPEAELQSYLNTVSVSYSFNDEAQIASANTLLATNDSTFFEDTATEISQIKTPISTKKIEHVSAKVPQSRETLILNIVDTLQRSYSFITFSLFCGLLLIGAVLLNFYFFNKKRD